MVFERFRADWNHEQWQAWTPPVALQQMQFIHHAVHQLQGVIRQVADAVLQDGCGEGQITSPLAVEPGGVLRFNPLEWQTAEVESRVGPQLGQALTECIGALHDNRFALGLGQICLEQSRVDGCILYGEGHEDRFRPERWGLTPVAGVEVCRSDQTFQQHFSQPRKALSPDQREIGVGLAWLASGLSALCLHPLIRHAIELRIQRLAIAFHRKGPELAVPASGILPTLFTAGGDQLEGQKQGPLRFDAFEFGQFLWLVVQPADVLHSGLVAVAQEAFVSVCPPQIPSDPTQGALHKVVVFNGPGGIAHHGKTGAVGLLAG